jgi:hypothetical protein
MFNQGDIVIYDDGRLYEVLVVRKSNENIISYTLKSLRDGFSTTISPTYMKNKFLLYNSILRNNKLEELGI